MHAVRNYRPRFLLYLFNIEIIVFLRYYFPYFEYQLFRVEGHISYVALWTTGDPATMIWNCGDSFHDTNAVFERE
jgi:hypothetical protein